MADCGSCNLCCKLLAVPDINKPSRMLCEHTTVHGGCAKHLEKTSDSRLLACHQFKCDWLESQSREIPFPRLMRPDQCHVVLGPHDRDDNILLYAQVDPQYPDAWTKEPVIGYFNQCLERGGKIEIIIDEIRFRLDENNEEKCPILDSQLIATQ